MRRTIEVFTVAIVLAVLVPAGALAQIPDQVNLNDVARGELGKTEEVVKTPEEQAIDHYNQGLALIQRADKLLTKAAKLEGSKREKTLNKVGKALKGAALEFATATTKNPVFPEAFSLLGYVHDRNGDYAEAVAAFDAALAIQPTDLRSMGAKGKALLALGRVDEAKQVYTTLSRINSEQANGLLAEMARWASEREADPAAADLTAWIQKVRTNS